jgi:transposase
MDTSKRKKPFGSCASSGNSTSMPGQLFVFRNKGGDRLKLLWWGRNGLAQYYKRLERGSFRWPKASVVCIQVYTQELELLLDGIDITMLKRLPALSFSSVV